MGNKKWWQRTAAAVCAAGLALSMAVVGAGSANATVDENAPSNNEPDWNGSINGRVATQVYSFTFEEVKNRPSLTVHGGSAAEGAVVNSWGRYNGTSYPGGYILSPNQLWEFIPDTSNAGTSLTSGWGYLRNRNSGKCLELNLSNSQIDQWTCTPGAANELWRAPWNGALEIKYQGTQNTSNLPTGGYMLYLGVNGDCHGTTSNGDGEPLRLLTSVSTCTHISHHQEPYQFATNKVTGYADGYAVSVADLTLYQCLNTWNFRGKVSTTGQDVPPDEGVYAVNKSDGTDTYTALVMWPVNTGERGGNNQYWWERVNKILYNDSSPTTNTYQATLTCQPAGIWQKPTY